MTIAAFAAGYLAVVVLVLALMRAGKRADARAQHEHEALVRSMTPRASARFTRQEDPDREIAEPRRTG